MSTLFRLAGDVFYFFIRGHRGPLCICVSERIREYALKYRRQDLLQGLLAPHPAESVACSTLNGTQIPCRLRPKGSTSEGFGRRTFPLKTLDLIDEGRELYQSSCVAFLGRLIEWQVL